MSFITFLIQGTQCPALQEMQLDEQLSHVAVTYDADHRTIEQIKEDTSTDPTYFIYHTIEARGTSIITIDYSCIDKAEQIWGNFHRHILYTLSATVTVLAGLVTLSLSRVVTTRYIFLAQLAVACFFVIVFVRAEEIYREKPLFPGDCVGSNSAIRRFRAEIIAKGPESLQDAMLLLPHALWDRATEFFTKNEKNLLGFV